MLKVAITKALIWVGVFQSQYEFQIVQYQMTHMEVTEIQNIVMPTCMSTFTMFHNWTTEVIINPLVFICMPHTTMVLFTLMYLTHDYVS